VSGSQNHPSALEALAPLITVMGWAFILTTVPFPASHPTTGGSPSHAVLEMAIAGAALVGGIWVHEFGHALAAVLCGRRVVKIQIGSGPTILVVGRLDVHLWPSHGVTYSTRPATRRQGVLSSAAGPVTNLLIAALAITVFASALGPATIAIFLVQGFLGLSNLVPRDSTITPFGTDGKQIIRYLKAPISSVTLRPEVVRQVLRRPPVS